MSYFNPISVETSNLIAAIAALISALSALYARWAHLEAKRSNEIALLDHRKAIFDAFFELKMHMEQYAMRAEIEAVSKFYYSSRDSAIYFEKPLSDKISKYYSECFKVADLARLGISLSPNDVSEIKKSFHSATSTSKEIEQELSKAMRKSTTHN